MRTVNLKNLLSEPIRNGYSPICVEEYTGKWILGLGALDGNGLNLNALKSVPFSNKKIDSFMLRPGDFLVSRSNTLDRVGNAGLFRGEVENCAYPDLMMKFRVNEEKINPEFMDEYLRSDIARRHFKRCAAGTSASMVKITKSTLETLEIHLPPLEKQIRISNWAHIFSSLIEKTEALIAAKECEFNWLVTRLINKPGRKKKPLSEFILEVSKRNRDRKIDRVLSVTNHSGFVLPEDQFERRVASADLSNYKIVRNGEYAYNPSRINVGSIARLDKWDNGALSPMYTVFKIDNQLINSDYFLHWLSSSEAGQRIKKSAQGSVRQTVSFSDFGAILIFLPNLFEQRRIVDTLNTAQHEINLLKQLAENYRTQKRALMQKLLSGEWQINLNLQ